MNPAPLPTRRRDRIKTYKNHKSCPSQQLRPLSLPAIKRVMIPLWPLIVYAGQLCENFPLRVGGEKPLVAQIFECGGGGSCVPG